MAEWAWALISPGISAQPLSRWTSIPGNCSRRLSAGSTETMRSSSTTTACASSTSPSGWTGTIQSGCSANLALTRSILHPGGVLALAGIDTNDLAFLDEQGHANRRSRFQGSRLSAAARGIALQARVGLDDLQLDEIGRQNDQRIAVPECHLAHVLFLQPLRRIADRRLARGELFECFRIHEMPELPVRIQILDFLFEDVGRLHGFAGLEGLLDRPARLQVSDPDAAEGLTLAGFDELVLDDVVGVAVKNDLQACLEFVGAVGRHAFSDYNEAPGPTQVRGAEYKQVEANAIPYSSPKPDIAQARRMAAGAAPGLSPGRSAARSS